MLSKFRYDLHEHWAILCLTSGELAVFCVSVTVLVSSPNIMIYNLLATLKRRPRHVLHLTDVRPFPRISSTRPCCASLMDVNGPTRRRREGDGRQEDEDEFAFNDKTRQSARITRTLFGRISDYRVLKHSSTT